MKITAFLCVLLAIFGVVRSQTATAECQVASNSGVAAIEGTISMTQEVNANITINVHLTGFGSGTSKHGFHVHESGELGNQCSNAGGHYNPKGLKHGGPSDTDRHYGDLGNVNASNDMVHATISDHLVTLFGQDTVIGRSFVVHQDEDDLGRGNWSDSNTTGHAGPRMGCCIIINTTSTAGNDGSSSFQGAVWMMHVSLLFVACLFRYLL